MALSLVWLDWPCREKRSRSSAEVLAWQGISRSPAFPCKSGTPMVLSVPGERLFVRDAFLNDHWIREPCLKKTSAVLCARFRRMNPFSSLTGVLIE
ncbi:hypothetical protein CA85_18410 [Allorhodopirellula solitaria]|uniref:Uncharacterized protein n=1 Tax=Allorhodopirellula solitaria TaxID=2527987 RepID=A0A5C5YFU8_9BACT|nr:hypothetical protein CA85_18410 [Allorhodopirellula solitaria]